MGFQWLTTEDGSPTLAATEAMHHSGGALTETLLIYGEPLKTLFSKIESPKILSLGLGLGYVEWTIAAEALKRDQKTYEIVTLESVEPLVKVFSDHLQEKSLSPEVQSGLDEVLERVAKAQSVSAKDLKKEMSRAAQEKAWSWDGILSPEKIPNQKFHGILYDAFSSKTNAELWSEEFLLHFLKNCAEENCVFSTYACTGNLKRALKASGFEVTLREGFKGKRHSTLAFRGPKFISRPDF